MVKVQKRVTLTVAVSSKRSFGAADFDGLDAEPLVQVGMFRFPARRQRRL